MAESSDNLLAVLRQSRELGFLGPGPTIDHVHNGELFLEALQGLGAIDELVGCLDLGSGGGVPGLVIADALPGTKVTLLDASERRIAFLREVAPSVSGECEVVRGRAETLAHRSDLREQFDVVTARSFAHPSATLECGSGFVRVGGVLLLSESPDDRRWPANVLELLGFRQEATTRAALGGVACFRKVAALDQQYPRRDGVPKRRPLF